MKKEDEELEDTTKYGEFISSYFAWLTLDAQKQKTSKMEEMTKKKDIYKQRNQN